MSFLRSLQHIVHPEGLFRGRLHLALRLIMGITNWQILNSSDETYQRSETSTT